MIENALKLTGGGQRPAAPPDTPDRGQRRETCTPGKLELELKSYGVAARSRSMAPAASWRLSAARARIVGTQTDCTSVSCGKLSLKLVGERRRARGIAGERVDEGRRGSSRRGCRPP